MSRRDLVQTSSGLLLAPDQDNKSKYLSTKFYIHFDEI